MRLALSCVLLLFSVGVFSPIVLAIDCTRAKTEPERAICSNSPLKAFDNYLSEAYSNVRSIVPAKIFKEVRKKQIAWIKKRDTSCGGNTLCLMKETQLRTAELHGIAQNYKDQLSVELLKDNSSKSMQQIGQSFTPRQPLNAKEIYTKASQSVVVIISFNKKQNNISQGSGVVIGHNKVATNCHVLNEADAALVIFQSKPYKAESLIGNKNLDYCILYTNNLPATVADIANVSSVSPGQRVYTVGSPRGLELTIAEGLVSGLRTQDDIPLPLIQTTAAISPGSSGGGLFDEFGRVIGITTFLLDHSQNINFALPVELSEILTVAY